MIGTLIWRVKEAWAVLTGKKKTIAPIKTQIPNPTFLPKNEIYEILDPTLKSWISSKSIEFIFSEFNETRVNAGGANFSRDTRNVRKTCFSE